MSERFYRAMLNPLCLRALAWVFLIFPLSTVWAQTDKPVMQIEFMAAKPSWSNAEFVGHAFMGISIPVESGSKEDFYGFYPGSGNKALISGPGIVNSEVQKNPDRFSRVTVSISRPITEAQRREVLKLVDEWNSKNYSLTSQSCVDFVDSIARKLGWHTPARVPTDFPETYLHKLIDANP